jgi:hypothetical protein
LRTVAITLCVRLVQGFRTVSNSFHAIVDYSDAAAPALSAPSAIQTVLMLVNSWMP